MGENLPVKGAHPTMDEILDRATLTVAKLLRQQAALAAFGTFAFRETDLQKILTEAARVCADSLNVPFCKICRYRPNENDLMIIAGCGWKPNVIGSVVSEANETTPQGRAYLTRGPVVIPNIYRDNELALPSFYREHGIISTIDVVISSITGVAYGVLEVDSPIETSYDDNDINFLTGFANVLAEAVATKTRTETIEMFAHELQHRVRNNLQHIQAMLDGYAATIPQEESKEPIETIINRLTTMAHMYDHLLGAGLDGSIDFADYLHTLCTRLSDLQGKPHDLIKLVCTAEPMKLDLATVTSIGLVVAELVTNSYGHAFPDGRSGTITVALAGVDGAGLATLTIEDDGVGFDDGLEDKRHGMGLVKRILATVNGTIVLASDHGTRGTMTIPVEPVGSDGKPQLRPH
jgi:two-component sensor histidine kinase